jgi:hypothetical protein
MRPAKRTRKIRRSTQCRWGAGLGVAPVLIGLMGCEPDGKIANSSTTKECGDELTRAVQAFKDDLRLAFEVKPSDAKTLFSTGKLEKQYARDGIRYSVYFGLEKNASGCSLEFYKRTSREPGTVKTTTGDYGTVSLDKCKCE